MKPSQVLTRNYSRRATTYTVAGGCESTEANSDLVLPLWFGTITAAPCARIGSSKSVTEEPRRCSKKSGRKNTTPAARQIGAGASIPMDCFIMCPCRGDGFTRVLGGQQALRGFINPLRVS